MRKKKEIKRLELRYDGKGVYRKESIGGYKEIKGTGELIGEVRQKLVTFFRWNYFLRQFEVINYHIVTNKF